MYDRRFSLPYSDNDTRTRNINSCSKVSSFCLFRTTPDLIMERSLQILVWVIFAIICIHRIVMGISKTGKIQHWMAS